MAAVSRKRKRTALDIHQKQDIILYCDSKPKTSHQQMADHFSTLWSTEVKRRTVGDIISHYEKWLAANNSLPGAKRAKLAMHGDLEDALWVWFANKRVQNVVLSDEIVRSKAKDVGKELGITECSYSNGWLHRFKQRHNNSSHVLCGESAGVAANLIEGGRLHARDVISKYHPSDVFNMDETGLYYRMTPDRPLTTSSYTKGTKKSK